MSKCSSNLKTDFKSIQHSQFHVSILCLNKKWIRNHLSLKSIRYMYHSKIKLTHLLALPLYSQLKKTHKKSYWYKFCRNTCNINTCNINTCNINTCNINTNLTTTSYWGIKLSSSSWLRWMSSSMTSMLGRSIFTASSSSLSWDAAKHNSNLHTCTCIAIQ
jgi:hypothetical protein